MADDIKIAPSTGVTDPSVATDDVAGRHFQVVKIALGADGVADLVGESHPIPVDDGHDQPLTDVQLRATAVPVSGTMELASATLAALESVTATIASWPTDYPDAAVLSKLEAMRVLLAGTLAVSGPLTDAQLRSTAVPISGTVTASGPLTDTQLRASVVPVGDGGGSLTVDGTVAVSGTVPVSGPLTDTELRASAVQVSGTVTANTGLSQPLTDAQLRATAVPVSGTISTGLSQPLTDDQLRATAVPVSGPLTDSQLRATAVPVSGTVTASGPLTDVQLRAAAVRTERDESTIIRQLNNTLGRLTFSATPGLLRTEVSNTPNVGTVTTGNIGFGDAGKPAAALLMNNLLFNQTTGKNFVRS